MFLFSDETEAAEEAEGKKSKSKSKSSDPDKVAVCKGKKKKSPKGTTSPSITPSKSKSKSKGKKSSYKLKYIDVEDLEDFLEESYGGVIGGPVPEMEGMVLDEDCDAVPGMASLSCDAPDYGELSDELAGIVSSLYSLPFSYNEMVLGVPTACNLVYRADAAIISSSSFPSGYQAKTYDGTEFSFTASEVVMDNMYVAMNLGVDFTEEEQEFLVSQQVQFSVVSGYMKALSEGGEEGDNGPLLLFFLIQAEYDDADSPVTFFHIMGEKAFYFGEEEEEVSTSDGGRLLETGPTLCDDFLARALAVYECPEGQEKIEIHDESCVPEVQADGEMLYEEAIEAANGTFVTNRGNILVESALRYRHINLYQFSVSYTNFLSAQTHRSLIENLVFGRPGVVYYEGTMSVQIEQEYEEALAQATCQPLVESVFRLFAMRSLFHRLFRSRLLCG